MATNDDFIVKNGLVVRAASSTYQSTSTTTGAIVTPGGLGIGQNATIGGQLNVASTSSFANQLQINGITKVLSTAINTATVVPDGNALQVAGGIYAANINISGIGLIKGSQILTQADGFKGGVISQPLIINTNTQSTSTSSGALTTPGGIGFGGNLNVGGSAWVTGTMYLSSDIYYQTQHLLSNITTSPGPGIVSKVTFNGYTATIITTNTGVLSVTGGTGINVDNPNGNITVSNIGVTSIQAGTDITVDYNTGTVTVSDASTLQSVLVRGNGTDQQVFLNNTAIGTDLYTTNVLNVLGSIGANMLNVASTSYIGGAIVVTTSNINRYVGGIITNTLRIQNTTSSVSTTTGALVVDGGLGIGQDVNVGGSLFIQGGITVLGSYTTVTVNSTQTVFTDPVIDLGSGYNNRPLAINDGLDRGLLLHYNTGSNSTYDTHAFIGRQASTGQLVFLTDILPGGNENVPNPYTGNPGTMKLGQLVLVSPTASTSSQAGALTVVGGVGIQGDLNVGGSAYHGNTYDNGNRVVTNVNVTSTLYSIGNAGSGIAVQSTVVTGSFVTVNLTNTGIVGLFGSSGISIAGFTATTGMIVGVSTITNTGVLTVSATGDLSTTFSAPQGQAYNSGNVTVINNSTLQTVTDRGFTTTNTIYINNTSTQMIVTGTNVNIIPGNGPYALNVAGGITATTLYIAQAGYINNAQIVTSATINAFSGGTINNSLYIAATATSTSSTTGALRVAGGVGLATTLNVGGLGSFLNTGTALSVTGNALFSSTIYVNTVSALTLGLDLVSIGTGTITANGVDLLSHPTNVRYVSASSGNNNNDGLRPNSAYATIAKALSVATTGTSVYLAAGTYTEVFPLTIPAGVAVQGAGIRSTIVQPTSGSNTNNGFLLNGEVLVSDLTVANFFQPGYGFAFTSGAKITTKSPYIQRVSVITRGSVTSASDPFGFNQADAGNGAKLDAGVLDVTSLEPAVLFNEATFIVPNAVGIYMTNGARAELLNGFTYFASKSIQAEAGATGFAGVGKTRLKLSGITGSFGAGDIITYKNPSGNIKAQGTIASTDGTYVYLAGPVWGFNTVTDRAGKTVTPYGNAKQSTAQFKFGTSSYVGDGTGDYVEVLNSSDFQFGSLGSYTFEGWIRLNSLGKIHQIVLKGITSPYIIRLRVTAGNVLNAVHGSANITGITALATGTWYHVALVRNADLGTFRIYLNGSVEAYTTGVTDNADSTDPLNIGGAANVGSQSLDGYIDDFRASNIARYTSGTYTLPTSATASDESTTLMLNFDGGANSVIFVDSYTPTQNVTSNAAASATRIVLADYHAFGAELRCIGSASVYGTRGVVANGTGTDLKLIAYNMSHIGAGKDITNDSSLVVQANEVIQTNGGVVFFQTIDQTGNFRVGTSFLINEQTGNVSFGTANVNLSSLNQLTITDGTNNAIILPTAITVGNLSISGNSLSALSGGISITPSSGIVSINSSATIGGGLTISGSFAVPALTDSISTSTGALTVGGGLGVGLQVQAGSTITTYASAISTSSILNNAIVAPYGGIGAQTLYLTGKGYSAGNEIVTTATIGASLGGFVPNALRITSLAQSTSTNTGALVVDGGVGIGGNLTVGGNLNLLGGGSVLTNVSATTDAYIGASVTKTGTTATINIVNLGVQSLSTGSGLAVSATTGTVTISSIDTLDLVVARNSATSQIITMSNAAYSTSTIVGNALQVTGGIGAAHLYLSQDGWINGAQIVTSSTIGSFVGGQAVTSPLQITSTATYALQVSGGALIGGNTVIQGSLQVAGTVTSINSTSVDIGNKVIFLSTLSGAAIQSAGAGIVVGKDDGIENDRWASLLFDGGAGAAGNWISKGGLNPFTDSTYGIGTVALQWNSTYIKTINASSVLSTSSAYSTSTIAGNALQVTGGIGARSIYLTTDGYIGGFPIVTSGNISTYAGTYDGATPIHNPLQVVNTSTSTSVNSGALQVSGGAGIVGDLYVGGSARVANRLYVTNTATIGSGVLSTTPTNGSLVVTGGVGVQGNMIVNGTIESYSNISATNNATVGNNLNLTAGLLNLNNTVTNNITAANTLTIVTSSNGNINIGNSNQNINMYPSGQVYIDTDLTANGVIFANSNVAAVSSSTGALRAYGGISTQQSLYVWRNITQAVGKFTNLYSTASSLTSIAGNTVEITSGGIGAQTLYLEQAGTIAGALIVTTATINQYSGGTIGNTLNLSNTTNSLSTATGALTVAGGVGIGKDVNVGGSLYLQGDLFVDGNRTIVNSTEIQTGDKIIYVSTAAASALLASGSGIAVGKPGTIRASLLFDGVSSWGSSASINPSGTGTGLGTYSNAWSYAYFNTIKVVGNTTSTNTLSGSLQVLGGISATENLYLGTNRTSTLTNTYNALTTLGGASIGGQLTITGPDAWLAGSPILTANNTYQVNFNNTTDATNTQTAAVTVAGGLGVGSTLIVGGQQYITSLLESTVTNTQNALVVSGGIYSDMLMVNQIATVNGGVVITTATIGNFSFNGGTISKPIIINSATQATSTITGAFQVTNGGAGIGGNVWIGGALNVTANSSTFKTITVGTATITTGTVSSAIFNTATQAGNALQVVGGVYAGYLNVKNQAWINGSPVITAATINSFSGGTINNPLAINDSTQATSTTTGALKVINGGLGVGGNIWSGGYFEFVDPFTASYDGYFGINTGLNAINIGSNNTNLPLAFVQNKNEIGRITVYNAVGGAQGAVLGVGNTDPRYGIHVNASSAGTWNWIQTANTMTNLMSLNNTLENSLGIGSSDISKLAFASFNPNGDGTTFEHWIASGQQNAGTASALVFAGGAWDNNLNTNTTVEWARFLANGTFSAKGNIVTTAAGASTATIGTNAMQVSGGGWFGSLNVTGVAWVGNSKVITAATIASYNFNGGTITTPLYVNTTTQAVNNSSGAIRTSGGISAVGNIYAGTNFYGNLIATNVTATNINVPGNPLTIGGIVTISTTTDQTGAGTGALQVSGGAAITQSLYVGSNLLSTSTIAGNAIQVPNGGIGAQNLYLSGNGYIGNAQIVTSANINSFSGGTINNALTINNPTQSISTITGAIVITNGGLGMGGNLWVGGNANVLGSMYLTGDLYVDGTQTFVNSTNIQTGDKVIYLSTASGNAAVAINSGLAIGNTTAPYASMLFDGINSWVSQGNINPSTSGGWNLGSATLPWNTFYAITSRFSGAVDSTTTQTGSLQVVGGAGIGKSLTVGNTATVQSTLYNLTSATGNAIYTPGGIGAKYLTIDTNAYVNGSAVITVANIGGYAYNGGYVNNAIVVNSTTNATAALNTGSIVTYGGLSVTKDTYTGGTINVASTLSNTGTIAGNAVAVTGGIGANTLYIATAGYIGASPIITAANINSFSGGTINAALTINNGTQAVSTTTGALIVQNGGAGIGGNLYTGGFAAFGQAYNTQGTLGNTASGSLQVLGGAGIAGNLTVASNGYFGGNVGINTASPNQALEVNGNIVAGAYNYSRVQITNAGGSQAIYEIATTETTPRWQIGRDLLGIGTSGIAFMNANQTFGTGGASIGAVSGLNGAIGFYSTNGTSMTLRGIIDSGAAGGNMGIGATSNLQGKLHLSGSASSGYGLYATGGNIDHVFRSGNAGQYVDVQVTRTGGGAQSDWRIGIAGAASNFIATAAQGDAVMTYSTNMIIANQSNYEMARFGNGSFTISTATAAVSTQSGSIVTYGGVGIGGDLYVGATANITGTTVISQSIASTSSIAGNALQVKGGIGAQSIYLTNASWINGYQIVTTQNIGAFSGAFNGGTITAPLFIANTADSGSTSSGALYTTGGVGISRQLYVGGITTLANTVNVTGQTNLLVATQSNSTVTGSLVVTNGGIGLGGNIWQGGNHNFSTNVGKIRWQTMQLAVNDDAGAGNGSVFLNGGNAGFPATTSSNQSVVIGSWAGPAVSGAQNTLVGNSAGYNLTSASANTIFGQNAGYNIVVGTNNTLMGVGAGNGNSTTLSNNVAIGYQALNQSIGTQNVALGYQAGKAITSGAYNVVIGGIDGSTIATSSNNVLLSDGQGNLRAVWNSGGVLTHPGQIAITNISSATSTATGALTIAGGLGVAGDIYARNIYANGTLVGTGGSGGGGSGTSTSTPYINVYTATVSVSTLTGGLTTVGGAGIGKDLFVGGPVVIGDSTVFINSGANLITQKNAIYGGASISNGVYSQGGNLLVYSSDYSQANWTKLNSSYQAGSTYSPDGTLNASKLVETSATGNHYFQQVISQTGPVTVSVFMQAADRTYGAINLTVAGVAHTAWFNLSTGAVANTAAGLYPVTGRIELVPYVGTGNWYRCSLTVNAPGSATATLFGIYTAIGSGTVINDSLTSYTGTAGFGIYIYGAQVEPGYIAGYYTPTTGSALPSTSNNIYTGGSLYVATTATVAGSTVTTYANLMSQFGGTTNNSFTIASGINSVSTITGSLVITNGGIGVGGNVYIGGTLYATAKSFLIDHPTKPGQKLQYGSLEGPENGVYVRGRCTTGVIELPDYWTALVDETSITVDITPIGTHQKLYVDRIEDNKIYIGNENIMNKKINCFYTVWAERKDVGKLDVEGEL
jgi:hypothetical protein